MYKLSTHGVIKNKSIHIPNNPNNRHWREYQAWLSKGNIPGPADPAPIPEMPAPSITELIQALDNKNKGNSADWDTIVLQENKKPKRIK